MIEMPPASQGYRRLPFIDFTRGIVMLLMAWDHASLFWNPGHRGGEGLMRRRPAFPNFTQFLLRFITHYCAPTFIFLAGTALALSTSRRLERGQSQREISLRMVKRGGVLLLLEAFVVSPAFGSPPTYFGVLACIGSCFIIFSVYRLLPTPIILATSLAMILLHTYIKLDWLPAEPWARYLRVILHDASFDWYPYVGLYPIIPWLGVMGLGWCFGIYLLRHRSDPRALTLKLIGVGVLAHILWLLVRWLNGYGNILPRLGWTAMDWLYMAKYPPSLAFLLWTLGGMSLMLALGLILQDRGGFTGRVRDFIISFGRVPLFFYCFHLWFYRLTPPGVRPPPLRLDIWGTALLWVVGILALWRLCLRYWRLKRAHPDSLLQYI